MQQNIYNTPDNFFEENPCHGYFQGPPRPHTPCTVTDSVIAFICLAVSFLCIKLFSVSPAFVASGYFHLITAFTAVITACFCRRRLKAGQGFLFAVALGFCAVPFFSSTVLVKLLSLIYAAVLTAYFAYSRSSSKKLFAQGFTKDIIAALLTRPFAKFTYSAKAFALPFRKMKSGNKTALYILAGLLISIPFALVAVLFLSSADDNFRYLSETICGVFGDNIIFNLFLLALSIPFAFYLGGMIYNSREDVRFPLTAPTDSAKAPTAAVCAALTPVTLIYLLFFLCQIPYFTAAFTGEAAEGYTLSEFARKGFFELCAVSVINFVIIQTAHYFSKHNENGEKPFSVRVYSIVFCTFTLLLIASAMSKMLLYITEMGLTELRFYTTWFMLLLGVFFVIFILREIFPSLNCIKLLFAAFTACLALLCLSDPDAAIARYNVNAYKEGLIESADISSMSGFSQSAAPYISEYAEYVKENGGSVTEAEDYFKNLAYEQEKPWYFGCLFVR